MNPLKTLYLWLKSRNLAQGSVNKRYALAEACLIGLVSAIAALCLKNGINWLGSLRVHTAHQFGAGIVLPLTGLSLGYLAGWFIEYASPAAKGGGIPQVKAALAQFPIPMSLRVAIVKGIGTILILGAGLTLGRRGPTVHIGAALAGQLSNWLPTSPDHRRQMIAAGAAAGLAAGFNTPITGVLFVIEELMRDASDLTLETAIVASFTGAVISRLLGSSDLNLPPEMLNSEQLSSFSAPEIPLYICLGALAGLLGAIFNKGIMSMMSVYRHFNLAMAWQIGIAGLVSGSIIALLPPVFQDNAGVRDILITGEADWSMMAIAFVAYFGLTILAYSSGAPGGLFSPALVLGSSLGYLFGMGAILLVDGSSEYTYALAGMGAFFTAIARVPVTAIVIVFELTTDFNLVLPLMLACATAYIVGDGVFHGSIYEHLLKFGGIDLKANQNNNAILADLRAKDVMQTQVESLSANLRLDAAIKIMSRSHHRGFPVLATGELVGIITQSDLSKLGTFPLEILVRDVMTSQVITIYPDAPLSDVLYLLNRYQLSRLPVIEGKKLVGIITRTDIIRVEAKQLSGESTKPADPSYLIYQTRSPARAKGRLLLPLANPENAPKLLTIASAIAHYYDYEIECLHIITVPKHSSPMEARVSTAESRKLLHSAERLGRKLQIPIHTQIRVSHDYAEAILEAIAQSHSKMLIMGWKGVASTPEHIFGNIIDTLMQEAPCDLILVKPSSGVILPQLNQWLIPIAGGPNGIKALSLLPALSQISKMATLTAKITSPEQICLCQVYKPQQSQPDFSNLTIIAQSLQEEIKLPIITIPIYASSISDAIVNFANKEQFPVVILGASREGLLKQTLNGNIPEAIASQIKATVILVRGENR